MSIALVEPGYNKLDFIKRQIAAGHARVVNGTSSAEWVEGSLIMAAGLRGARENCPADISFGAWLAREGLDYHNKNDRGALINMALDLTLARAILSETTSHSYENIWRENRHRFPPEQRPSREIDQSKKRYSKPRIRVMGRAMNHRRMKLGDEVIDMLKGTSLDNAAELDELVRLNRSAPEGELTDDVQHLVSQAVAGKDVSAIAYTEQAMPISTRKKPSLIQAWRKRMIFAWEQADYDDQQKFVDYLIEHMKKGTAS